mgnify:CR=1 FL=1
MAKRGVVEEQYDEIPEKNLLALLPEEVYVTILNSLGLREFLMLTLTSKQWSERSISLVQVLNNELTWVLGDRKTHLFLFQSIQNFGPYTSLTTLNKTTAPTEIEFWKNGLHQIVRNLRHLCFFYSSPHLHSSVLLEFTNLTSLHLYGAKKLGSLDAFFKLTNLRILSLKSCFLDNFTGLGFLSNLEVLSIAFSDSDGYRLLGDQNYLQIDQALCYLTKLRSLRLHYLYTCYSFLKFLQELLFLDLLQTKIMTIPNQDEDESFKDTIQFLCDYLPKLKYLRYLALPKEVAWNPLLKLKQHYLTTLITNRETETYYLPNLKYYRFMVKEKHFFDQRYHVSRGVSLLISGRKKSQSVLDRVTRVIEEEEKGRGALITQEPPSDQDFWDYCKEHFPDVPNSILLECSQRQLYVEKYSINLFTTKKEED